MLIICHPLRCSLSLSRSMYAGAIMVLLYLEVMDTNVYFSFQVVVIDHADVIAMQVCTLTS
jgi:hypothetical protein